MIKAIIFDVGGVLHKNRMDFVFRDIRKTLRINKTKFNKALKIMGPLVEKGKITERKLFQKLIKLTESKSKLPKKSLFLREYEKKFAPNNKVLNLVKELKKRKYKLVLLSNTIASHTRFKMIKGMYKSFGTRIFSYRVGLIKPDPKIYKLTLKKLRLQPEETIFIDDKIENVKTANKLGMNGILFKYAKKLRVDLKKLKVL